MRQHRPVNAESVGPLQVTQWGKEEKASARVPLGAVIGVREWRRGRVTAMFGGPPVSLTRPVEQRPPLSFCRWNGSAVEAKEESPVGPSLGRRRPLAAVRCPRASLLLFLPLPRAAAASQASTRKQPKPHFLSLSASCAGRKEGSAGFRARACGALLSRAQGRCSPRSTAASTVGAQMGASIVCAGTSRP